MALNWQYLHLQTFLAQKYGYRPFPPKIFAAEFEKMSRAITNDDDRELIAKWFIKDENSVPVYYLLQPIRTQLIHYADNSDQDKKKKV